MMAPSIFASSDSRCGLNAASSRNPPEQMLSTSGPSPTTMSAPMRACRMRSRPSRSGVPGRDGGERVEQRDAAPYGHDAMHRTGDACTVGREAARSRSEAERLRRRGDRLADAWRPRTTRCRAGRRAPTPARWPAGSRGGRPRPAAGRSGPPGAARRRDRPRRTRRGRPAAASSERRRHDGQGDGRGRRPARRPCTPPAATAYTSASRERDPGPLARARRAGRRAGRRRRPGPTGAAGRGRCRSHERLHLDEQRPVPSIAGTTTEPGDARPPVGEEQRARRRARRRGPPSVISNRPSSPVAPKRCFTARSSRSAWWRSPSKASTVSTTCSSTRGPASAPSLVTWPTSTVARPAVLGLAHEPVGALAHLGRPSPAPSPSSGSYTVWIESTTRTSGRTSSTCGEHVGQVRLGEQPQAVGDSVRAARPAPDLLARLLGGDVAAPCRPSGPRPPRPGAAGSTCRCRARRRAA